MTPLPTPGSLEELENVMDSETFWQWAEPALNVEPSRTGRRPIHPLYMGLVFEIVADIHQGYRKAEAELRHPVVWRMVQAAVRKRFPRDPSQWLGDSPMRRHHYDYMTRNIAAQEAIAAFREAVRVGAVVLTRRAGIMDPEGPGSLTHPDASRCLYGDGKVLTPRYRARMGETRVDLETGEVVQRRFDPDATTEFEGGGQGSGVEVHGTRFAHLSARSPYGRITFDVDHVPKGVGGEGKIILDMLRLVTPRLPGLLAIVYDMAWHGLHIQSAMTELGIISIAKVAAARRAKPGSERVAKSAEIGPVKIEVAPGTVIETMLIVDDGRPGVEVPNVDGDLEFFELERFRIHRNRNRSGTYRFYQDYRYPAILGGGETRLPLHQTPDDDAREFNRAENLRPIPPGDPDFVRLHGLRSDAESLNRGIEDTLYWGRARSVGARRQHMNLLAHVVRMNARVEAALRARERLRAA